MFSILPFAIFVQLIQLGEKYTMPISILEPTQSEIILENAGDSLIAAGACTVLAFVAAHTSGVDPEAVKLLTTAAITSGLHSAVSHIDLIKTMRGEAKEMQKGHVACQCLGCITEGGR